MSMPYTQIDKPLYANLRALISALCTIFSHVRSPIILSSRFSFTLMQKILITTLIFSYFYLSQAHAFLLITPAHTYHRLLWEKVLIVFDPMIEQQTAVTQVAISGSPSSFAILIPVRKSSEIHYTTTSIWRALERQMNTFQNYQREIKIYPYSWVLRHLIPGIGQEINKSFKRDVLRSKNTLIHDSELELHQWLLSKGLLLNTDNALSVKKVYQQGKVIACLWITPSAYQTSKQKNGSSAAQHTLSSSWIITSPTHEPFYETLFPSSLDPTMSTYRLSTKVDLTLLTEWKSQMEWDHSDLGIQQAHKLKNIDRFRVQQLNQKLRSTRWSFNRSGVLSQFNIQAHTGYRTLYFKSQRNYEGKKEGITHIKQHDFHISIEICLLLLWVLWWVWFKYAQNKR